MIKIAKTNESIGSARKMSWRDSRLSFMTCIAIGIVGTMVVQLMIDFQRFKNGHRKIVCAQ